MTLSQSILISLLILICFSPILSLEMEADIVHRMKERDIKPFVREWAWNKEPRCSRKITNFFKRSTSHIISCCFLIYIIFFVPKINHAETDRVSAIFIAFALWMGIFCLRQFLAYILHKKIVNNDFKYFKSISLLADISIMQPITTASRHNRLEMARLILNKWACIPECWNNEALYTAIENENLEMIELLLAENRHKFFNLDVAVTKAIFKESAIEIIELLFDKGGRFIAPHFDEVIKECAYFYVKLLMDLGINIDIKDSEGTPAIITTVLNNKDLVFELLLSKNVNIYATDQYHKMFYDYLDQKPEIECARKIRSILKNFRTLLKNHIYSALTDEKYNFHSDCAGVISEFLA